MGLVSISWNLTNGKPSLVALKRPGPSGQVPEPDTVTLPTRVLIETLFPVRRAVPEPRIRRAP